MESLEQGSAADGFLTARIEALKMEQELLAPGSARDEITAEWREKIYDSRLLGMNMQRWKEELAELDRDREDDVVEESMNYQYPLKEQEDDGPRARYRRELVEDIRKGKGEIESRRLQIEELNREEEGHLAWPDPVARARADGFIRLARSKIETHMSLMKQQVRDLEEELDAVDEPDDSEDPEDDGQYEAEGGDYVEGEEDAQWKMEYKQENVTGNAVPESEEDPFITELREALEEEIRELTDEPWRFTLNADKRAERIAEKKRKLAAITPRESHTPADGAVRDRSCEPPADRPTGLRGGCPAPQENNNPVWLQNERKRQAAEDKLQRWYQDWLSVEKFKVEYRETSQCWDRFQARRALLRRHGFHTKRYFCTLAARPDPYTERTLVMASRWAADVARLFCIEPGWIGNRWVEPRVDYAASIDGAWREDGEPVVRREDEEDWFEMYINY